MEADRSFSIVVVVPYYGVKGRSDGDATLLTGFWELKMILCPMLLED